jgi:uncharacterized protein YutE (UPF0331/DUF86 family)
VVNVKRILNKISFIQQHLARVRLQKDCTLDEFLSDFNRQDIVCFNLIQAIQGCADLANHLVSAQGWGIPGSYSESIEILVKEKVITPQQGETYRKMIAFRNRLVHEYAETNFTEVYEIMTTQLDDLDRFVEAISNYCHL